MNNIILNQKTGQTQVRIIKYDILRIVACFAIVLLHVSSSVLDTVNVHSSEFLIMIVYNSLTRFAVPIFFMLSGLFLLSPDRENIKLGKRILKLVSLFYVWSAFYGFQGIIFDVLTGGGDKGISVRVNQALYSRTLTYVVYSNITWLLHINPNCKTNMCRRTLFTIFFDFVGRIQVFYTLSDGSVSFIDNPVTG